MYRRYSIIILFTITHVHDRKCTYMFGTAQCTSVWLAWSTFIVLFHCINEGLHSWANLINKQTNKQTHNTVYMHGLVLFKQSHNYIIIIIMSICIA